jgi:hypothetical protein
MKWVNEWVGTEFMGGPSGVLVCLWESEKLSGWMRVKVAKAGTSETISCTNLWAQNFINFNLGRGHHVVFKVQYYNEIKYILCLSELIILFYFKCWQLFSA